MAMGSKKMVNGGEINDRAGKCHLRYYFELLRTEEEEKNRTLVYPRLKCTGVPFSFVHS